MPKVTQKEKALLSEAGSLYLAELEANRREIKRLKDRNVNLEAQVRNAVVSGYVRCGLVVPKEWL